MPEPTGGEQESSKAGSAIDSDIQYYQNLESRLVKSTNKGEVLAQEIIRTQAQQDARPKKESAYWEDQSKLNNLERMLEDLPEKQWRRAIRTLERNLADQMQNQGWSPKDGPLMEGVVKTLRGKSPSRA